MTEYTPKLKLLKKDPITDGNDTFNIKTMMNDNWDKIDDFAQVVEDKLNDVDDLEQTVNDLIEQVGNLEELDTDTKNNLIAAINEIYQKFNSHKADYEQHTSYAIATGTNSYAVNINGVTSLVEGMSIKVKFQNANTGTATLNINGLGAKEIRKSNGNTLSAGNIKAGQILHLVYTGSVFQLLGEGGEYGNVTPDDVIKGVTFGTEEGLKTGTLELTGNAAAADVLSGKTFYSTNPKSKLTGSMTNRGAVTHTITTQGGSYTIPAGYHNGSGKVTASFANLIPSNIRSGVNIGGIVGNMIDGSNMKKWATGHYYPGGGDIVVTGLAFKPEMVICGSILADLEDNRDASGGRWVSAIASKSITGFTKTMYVRSEIGEIELLNDGFRISTYSNGYYDYYWIAIG